MALGSVDVVEDRLTARRVWLRGERTGRWALLLSFAAGGAPLDAEVMPGVTLDADLHVYPGSGQLRGLVGTVHARTQSVPEVPGSLVGEAAAAFGDLLAADPWADRLPVVLTGAPVPPERERGRWWFRSPDGSAVPLLPGAEAWPLLARSMGDPIEVMGEWTHDGFLPLGFLPHPLDPVFSVRGAERMTGRMTDRDERLGRAGHHRAARHRAAAAAGRPARAGRAAGRRAARPCARRARRRRGLPLDAARRRLARLPPGAASSRPRQTLDPAPEPAQLLLGRLLRERDPALVDQLARPLHVARARRPRRAVGAAGRRGRRSAAVPTGPWSAPPSASGGAPSWPRTPAGAPVGRRAGPGADRGASTDPAWTPELTAQALTLVEVSGTLRRRVRISPDARLVGRAVAGADLDAWRARTGLAPPDLLDLLLRERPERLDALVAALADATARQRHLAWAAALVAAGFARDDLVALVPADRFAALARDWVRAPRPRPGGPPARDAARPLGRRRRPDRAAAAGLRHGGPRHQPPDPPRRRRPAARRGAGPAVADLAEAERDGEPAAGFVEAERLLRLRLDIDRTFRAHDPQEHP